MKDIGERLTAYEPLWENWYKDSFIGSGGSGKVYKFRQELFGQVRWSAVKVLPIIIDRSISQESREAEIEERREQVSKEITNMFLLGDKPHLVHCLNYTFRDILNDSGQAIGFDVLIQMEYYQNLTEYIEQKGVLSPAEVEKLARQIGEGLRTMHGMDMLHRDIKPDNIYVDEAGEFYLGDFGIAKQTRAGTFATFVGTQPFMAPEVWNARTPNEQHYGAAADIYSLGITLYYLLNGNRLPMVERGANRNAIDAAIFGRLSGKVFAPPENGSDSLRRLVMDCCAYDPADRIGSAEEFLARLDGEDEDVLPLNDPVDAVPVITEDTAELDKKDFELTDSIYIRPGDPTDEDEDDDDDYEDEEETELIVRPAPARPERRQKQLPAKPKKEPAHLSSATKKAALTIGICLCVILGVGALFFTKTICLHDWQAATCTRPETCVKCHRTRGDLAAHNFEDATCTHPRRCTVCGAEEGEKLPHSWKEATCTQPRTCALCGAVDGEPLGHKWVDATCETDQYCEVCGLIGQEAPGHKWKEATCTAPKTCEVCGEKEGEPIGHKWKAATCTEPETCENCGETKGKALGHKWTAATLTTPKTCSVCGATEGTALDYVSKGTMYVNVQGDTLALREEKSSSSKKLASIPDCTPIQVWYTGSSGWYYALYDNTYGYVKASYISETDPMLGDGGIYGWNTANLGDIEVTVTSAEIKGTRLTVELSLYNNGTDFNWPDIKIYYNGNERSNGTYMDSKDMIVVPYGTRTVTVSTIVGKDFGKGSLNNIVVVDANKNKIIIARS
ncbi:serine/threonine-protein kinase [uncultured Ruminococcus sp.]|uniref:serine/threonine-protein kinase n=1 Tax=uncultured Ruminococcus sp. TaxID=165186 RepID=UPI0025D4507C|nr:serine/threonine-protein kinase [uncultured Ruminococcus sp.]